MKRTYYKYKARCLVLDANGPGLPIVDMLTKPTYIAETGEVLPKKLGYYRVIYNKYVVKNWKAKLFNIAS